MSNYPLFFASCFYLFILSAVLFRPGVAIQNLGFLRRGLTVIVGLPLLGIIFSVSGWALDLFGEFLLLPADAIFTLLIKTTTPLFR